MKGGLPLPPTGTEAIVDGALSADYDPASGTITAVFPRTHRLVDNVTELNNAIAALPGLPKIDYAVNKNVIELTEAFYTWANGDENNSFITIGAGNNDNNFPYTVRGLGKDKTALTVGVLLANNNITLEDLRVNITDKDKGVPHSWNAANTQFYRSAVSIGHYKEAPSTTNSTFNSNYATTPTSKYVTVRNCDINFTANNSMLAGVYIVGSNTMPIKDISIANNTISVEATNSSGYAVQALLVVRYDPSLSITNNGLKSKNTPSTHNRPAGALFMQLAPDIDPAATPRINGNTVNGSPTYDFYINILSGGAGRITVPAMVANGFATPGSRWMTADSTDTGEAKSFYKKLIETLLPQTRAGIGYGYLALYLDGAKYSLTDCVFEAYYRESDRLYAIDFWGYDIENGAYKTGDNSYTNNVRARLEIGESGTVINNKATFCWFPGDTAGINLPTPSP
jgi:hypothetical protein